MRCACYQCKSSCSSVAPIKGRRRPAISDALKSRLLPGRPSGRSCADWCRRILGICATRQPEILLCKGALQIIADSPGQRRSEGRSSKRLAGAGQGG
ncbi:hypothetical protein BC834DRAFT_632933 [Gloeopeniophorella convolvens]|nr:hypothetical protein BC834DRAFT_632933 [Gloeopeniophorella convolvens]